MEAEEGYQVDVTAKGNLAGQSAISSQQYKVGDKNFTLKSDFIFEELEWLEVVVNRLEARSEKQEVRGSFTRDEIEKTLKMILVQTPLIPPLSKGGKEEGFGFEHDDFMKMPESYAVKIIADFFLQRAVLGIITSGSLMN